MKNKDHELDLNAYVDGELSHDQEGNGRSTR